MAEVLITLGIIGVVAAMTMPTLMANYKKKEYAVRAKQAYSMLAQAIKLSELQNDEVKYWDMEIDGELSLSNTDKVVHKYILPYLNNTKLCGEGSEVEDICGKHVSRIGQSYFLGNGTILSIVANNIRGEGTARMLFIADVNGKKGPNILGTDAFYFVLSEKGLKPYGWDWDLSREDILNGAKSDSSGNTISCKAVKNEDNEKDSYRHGCTALLMMDGWEFKPDYPFNAK